MSRRTEHGFTLIELLIAASIGALVVAALIHVYSLSFEVAGELAKAGRVEEEASLLAELLERDVSSALRAGSPAAATLDLELIGGDRIRYGWSGAGAPVTRQLNGGATDTVASAADTLVFGLLSVSRPFTHESYVSGDVETSLAHFHEGDWDGVVASTTCLYGPRGTFAIDDGSLAAEEFRPSVDVTGFTRARVRLAAVNEYPTQSDLVVQVYTAQTTSPYYPLVLKALGTLSRVGVTPVQGWKDATLSVIDSTLVPSGTHCWVVFRNDSVGGGYAGTIEYEQLLACTTYPNNGLVYRESIDDGTTWLPGDDARETFFQVYGNSPTAGLVELTDTITDTTGVTYSVTVRDGGETRTRVGQVAFRDL